MGRRKKKVPASRTRVYVVQDRSGSMGRLRAETVSGFNEYVDQLEGDMSLTLIQFDTRITEVFVDRPLTDVPELTAEDFVPGGMTALLDGVGRAIKCAEDATHGQTDDKVMIVIMTDGGENSSREYKHADILKKLEDKRKDGWEFVFLGAGEESWAAGQMFGIADTHQIKYGTMDCHDHGVAYAALAGSANSFRRGGGAAFEPQIKASLEGKAKAEPKARR